MFHCEVCDDRFETEGGLLRHMGHGCEDLMMVARAKKKRAAAVAEVQHEASVKQCQKQTRADVFEDDMRDRIAIQLGHFRHRKLVAGTVVDDFKDQMNNWLEITCAAIELEINSLLVGDDAATVKQRNSLSGTVRRHLKWFQGVSTPPSQHATARSPAHRRQHAIPARLTAVSHAADARRHRD
jgi:hypothetical protein